MMHRSRVLIATIALISAAVLPAASILQPPGQATQSEATAPPAGPPIATGGLDPVLLVAGQEEKGKPEIVADHNGHRYLFVSETHRARFASNPQKYAIRNDTCLVVPGAPIDPSLFAVHEGKIYAFATADCVQQFKAGPAQYVMP